MPCDNVRREGRVVAVSQGAPRTDSKSPKGRKRQGGLFLASVRGSMTMLTP